MIAAINLSMRYGGKILFRQVNFQLLPKQHYGLVGPNGSGKSTLLKIILGEVTQETGDIAIPSLQIIGALKQDHFLYETCAIRDVVIMGKPQLWKAMQQKEELLQHHPFTESDCNTLANCEKTIEELHGYSAYSNAAELLEGLGIATHLHQSPLSTLSGGYKLRVLLAQLLFSNPDILLLDEPTNHLDIFSIKWLEEHLKDFPGILLLSSHDRLFLNAVCNHILDLDYGTITTYKGNYDAFLTRKEEAQSLKESALEKQQKKRDDMMDFVERFGAKATKASQAQSRLKAIEKLDASMENSSLLPSSRRAPNLHFIPYRPSGAIALKTKNIRKCYGEKRVLHDVSFEIERGERIAFLGPNGIGKSTLLEILVGNRPADEGEFEWGHAVSWAYFPQDHTREVEGNISLIDWLNNYDPQATREQLQQVLARALFSGDDVKKPVSVLSGGETARLILAKMMLVKHNVLIFDEPTNHLDMEAIDKLIEALKNYAGTVLFVSHNRYFVQQLASRIIEMRPEGISDFKCGYDDYLAMQSVDHLDGSKGLRNTLGVVEKNGSSKQQYLDQKQQKRLEQQLQRRVEAAAKKCHELECALEKMNERLATADFYMNTSLTEQKKLLTEKQQLEEAIHQAFAAWEAAETELDQLTQRDRS